MQVGVPPTDFGIHGAVRYNTEGGIWGTAGTRCGRMADIQPQIAGWGPLPLV